MQLQRFALCVTTVCALLVSHATAWNCLGHMLTAQVAVQLLQSEAPAANAYYTDLSNYQQMQYVNLTSLTEASCWPDDIKDFTHQYNTWHYYDQCYLRTQPGSNVTCPTTPEGNATAAIAKAVEKLSSPTVNVSKAERAFWLTMLVHVVGDMHQPLHTTTLFDETFPKGDLAGNRFSIQIGANWTNLHKFHDDIAGLAPQNFPQRPLAAYPNDQQSIELLSTSLLSSQSFAYPGQANVTNVTVWLEEGYETCLNASYTLPDGQPLHNKAHIAEGAPYITKLRQVLLNKIALGGRRLFKILADAYQMSSSF